LMLAGVVK